MNSHKRWMIVAALCQAVALPGEAQVPQTINYQGKLVDGTNLVNASTTMVFRLYNNDSGGAQQYVETQTVTVVDGLYSAQVGAAPDFGTLAAAATNEPLYLEVQVGDTILAPRERVVSVMYALRAAGVTNGAISSAMLGNSAVTAAKLANNAVTGPKIAAGAISNVHVSAASIASNNIDWTQMPAGLEHGGFLSYTENGDFEVAPVATGADSIAQGAAAVVESDYSVIGGGETNWIRSGAPHSVIAGGNRNTININAEHSVIAGGRQNQVYNGAMRSFIGGGYLNLIYNTAYYSTIPGGNQNSIGVNARQATIGGGYKNVIAANASNAVIAGGAENVITNAALYAAIPGGDRNTAGGEVSFAAGRRAKATNDGTFVWADHTEADFGSTTSDQFLVRASGGVGINTNVTPEALNVAGRVKADGFVGDGSGLTNLSGGALVAGTVSNVHLANKAVTGSKIATATITFSNMAQNGAANGQVMKWGGSAWVAADDVGSSSPLASYSENGAFSPSPHAYAVDSIAQGCANVIFNGSDFSVIGGGLANAIADNSPQSAISGGRMNAIFQNTTNATIGGGY